MSGQKSDESFEDILERIGTLYVFNEDNYPLMPFRSSNTEKKAFAIEHSVFHMTKTIGRLAAECEAHGHFLGPPLVPNGAL